MPELPEVETVRRGLEKLIVGKQIDNVSTDNPKSFPNSPGDVEQFLVGAHVKAVSRRAKVLIIDLDTDYSLVIHLKMTGQLVFVQEGLATSRDPGSQSDERSPSVTSPCGLPSGNPHPPLVPEVNSETALHPLKLASRDARVDTAAEDRLSLDKNPVDSRWKMVDGDSPTTNYQIPPTNNGARFAGGHPNDSLIGKLPDRSTRVTFKFEDGSHLFFNDQRKFGWVRLVPSAVLITGSIPAGNARQQRSAQAAVQTAPQPSTGVANEAVSQELSRSSKLGLVAGESGIDAVIDFMRRVGPEPLEETTTADMFIERARRRNGTTIKAAILDQSVIAGIGNIYADEALWGAKIHPATRVREVTDQQLKNLFNAARDVLTLSIEKGGSTDRNYVDAEGKRGSYLQFANVFRRENQPCPRCGEVIIKTKVAGRGTHICPSCQLM